MFFFKYNIVPTHTFRIIQYTFINGFKNNKKNLRTFFCVCKIFDGNWLIDCYLTSSEQYFSCIHEENKFTNNKSFRYKFDLTWLEPWVIYNKYYSESSYDNAAWCKMKVHDLHSWFLQKLSHCWFLRRRKCFKFPLLNTLVNLS